MFYYPMYVCLLRCVRSHTCMCVAEEDEFDSYSRALLQYFLAEGVVSGHKLFVASAQDHPDDIIKVITHCKQPVTHNRGCRVYKLSRQGTDFCIACAR